MEVTSPNPDRCDWQAPVEFTCSEVWGGNRFVQAPVRLPGMSGWIYSRPCDGARGGDVHYLSTCSAGLVTRVVLADVVGHGEEVAQMSEWIHGLVRKFVNDPSPQRILNALNLRASGAGFAALTTAAFISYEAMRGQLLFGYAGHPRAMLYRRGANAWAPLELPGLEDQGGEGNPNEVLANLPLGVQENMAFDVGSVTLEVGDQLVVLSDGVPETPGPDQSLFSDLGVARILDDQRGSRAEDLGASLIDALHEFAQAEALSHDDVTLIVLDIDKRPRGSKILHMIVNQMRRLVRPRLR